MVRAPGAARHLVGAMVLLSACAAQGCRIGRHVRRQVGSMAVSPGAPSLSAARWAREQEAYLSRITGFCRGASKKDPVTNFLLYYYLLKPKQLQRWSPGAGVVLEDVGDAAPEEHGWNPIGLRLEGGRAWYDPRLCPEERVPRLRWARDLLAATERRAPLLNCYGLHEWAMLYHPEGSDAATSRHQALPLRVSQARLNEIVEEGGALRCTHGDAVRFFSSAAVPLLASHGEGGGCGVPCRSNQIAVEQPGCVHATMDLFKWATKLSPFVPSSTVLEALDLAIEARVVDMRASPYDLSAPGGANSVAFDRAPIFIETEEGRQEYQAEQLRLFHAAQPLRRRLVEHYDAFLRHWPELDGLRQQPGGEVERVGAATGRP